MDAAFSPEAIASPHPLLAGIYNGVMRTVDKPAAALSDLAAKSGVSATIRNFLVDHKLASAQTANKLLPAQGQDATNDATNAAAYQKNYGSNTTASLGNLLGQTAVIAPVIETGAGALGASARLLGAGLEDASPLAAKIVQGGAKLLGGTAGEGMPGVAGTATRTASLASHGAAIGGTAAAMTGQPVAQGAEYGAALGPAGSLAGKALGAATTIGKNMLSPLIDLSPQATQAAAVNKLLGAFQSDGLTPEQAIAKVQQLGPQGMLADVGGANVRNAAETVANSPGEGSNIAQQALEGRASSQAGRVNQAVKDATGAAGNIHAEADDLIAQRSSDAAPLYQKAFAGGSTAPLEDQFNKEYVSKLSDSTAAQQSVNEADKQLMLAQKDMSQAPSYLKIKANESVKAAQANLDSAKGNLSSTNDTLSAISERLKQAQADGTANAPGAVWSPRIQQFIDEPFVQQGIKNGYVTQRLEDLSNGVKTSNSEWGVLGTDENGHPVTGAVPTMRLLDAGKSGLDDMLEKYRDTTTGKLNLNKRGRAINAVRKSYLNELDNINPDYAAARQAYAGPSQSLDAMNMGKRALLNDPEVTSKVVSNLAPGDKQFFLSGVTRALQDKIESGQDGADVTRRIFGNDLIRNKIAAAFDNPDAFSKFEQQMESESSFAQTRNQVLKGSQTARRLAGQSDASQPLADAGRQLLSGNPGAALVTGAKGVANYLMQPSQAQSTALGNLLFTPGEAGSQQFQDAMQAMKPGAAKRMLNGLMSGAKSAALPASTIVAQDRNH